MVIEHFRSTDPENNRVILPTMEGFEILNMKEIIRLQGNGNFTDIFMTDGSRKMACRFLKHYEENLPYPFVRVHKSHIINLNFVKSYSRTDGGFIVMQDKSEILISPTYKEQFLNHFKTK
jgi:two-component system LytT family response regulator